MKPAVSDPPEIEKSLWYGFGGGVGWDIGANCGQSYDEMMTRFDTVIAFEPATECAPYLDDLASTNTSYRWLPIGLSDTDSHVELVELPDKIDTGQLVTGGTVGMEWNPEHPDAVIRMVECRTVDSLVAEGLPGPDFLKIDVEGHELKVLYGAKKELAINRPDLLVEFHAPHLHRSMVDLLEGYGYDVQTIRHPHYRPGTQMWFQHGWIKATQ